MISNERNVFDRISGIEGVPHKIRNFDIPIPWFGIVHGCEASEAFYYARNRTAPAFEREYVEGKTMFEGGQSIAVEHQQKLIDTVRAIHDTGVAWLDLDTMNILIAPDGRPFLFDFDKSNILEPGRNFEICKEKDLRILESLLKYRPS
jgi:serine/threonine protein kinase